MPFFGYPLAEKLPQIALSDATGLVEGSIESSWIGEQISRSPEVVPKNASHIGGRPKSGAIHHAGRGGGFTENELKSQSIVVEGPSRTQTQAPKRDSTFLGGGLRTSLDVG